MSEGEATPRCFLLVSATMIAAGCLVFVFSYNRMPLQPTAALALFVASAILSENYAVRLRGFSVSLAFPLAVAAGQLFGPAAAAAIAAAGFTNLHELRQRRPVAVYVFNLGQALCWGATAGWTYALAGGANIIDLALPLRADQATRSAVAMVAASLSATLVNALLVGLGASTLSGLDYWSVVRSVFAYLPTQVALGFVGFLMAIVTAIDPVALVLFLFPLSFARQLYQRYEHLRQAYLDTIRSLIGALESKDAYTSGHSERVATYACRLAEQMGMSSSRLDAVHQAALLHDIGKLVVPSAVISKTSCLTDEEMSHVRSHSSAGAELVGRIPIMRHLAEVVCAHHERVDGRGYPHGLAGAQIPEIARLLSVVDAYDAMTTDRPYRPAMHHQAALAELARQSGRQFDSMMVGHFVESGISCASHHSSQALQEPISGVA